jgi:hypothetical protein
MPRKGGEFDSPPFPISETLGSRSAAWNMEINSRGDVGDPAAPEQLKKVLGGLLEPVKVKGIIVTNSGRYAIRGIVITECPVEKRESGKDFEIVLEENDPNAIQRVIVDGRRLLPKQRGLPKKKVN